MTVPYIPDDDVVCLEASFTLWGYTLTQTPLLHSGPFKTILGDHWQVSTRYALYEGGTPETLSFLALQDLEAPEGSSTTWTIIAIKPGTPLRLEGFGATLRDVEASLQAALDSLSNAVSWLQLQLYTQGRYTT